MNDALTFERNFHPTLWGGESWEISAHSAGPSRIAAGELKGKALNEVMPDFPLLIKVIDAKTRLSVQVHPNETTCKVTGGDPKTEMWCLLDDGPIYAGLKPGTTPAAIEAAVESGKFEDLLVRHDAKAGDCFFIPGGLVHAIGDGVRLYEVQQSSNTTFRLYDWGRVGTDGRPRRLHVAESLKAIDYTLPVPIPVKEVSCPFFRFRQEMLSSPKTFTAPSGSFLVLYVVATDESLLLPPGASHTVTACGTIFTTLRNLI